MTFEAGVGGRHRLFAIERQPHGDARALAEFAFHLDIAAMQADEAFHDGEAETGAVMAAVMAGARLEERIADARQVGFADADAVVLDRDGEAARLRRARTPKPVRRNR